MSILKKFASTLPMQVQQKLKQINFLRQIKNGTFITTEPEYMILDRYVKNGDWVVDIGANVGHYTKKLSDLVGPEGRVIAFEPIPSTFTLLTQNTQRFSYNNVSLFNAAVSDKTSLVGMSIPKFSTGLTNYYEAHIVESIENDLTVLTIPIDSLYFDTKISLVKIDAEGHESYVINGMIRLINEFKPILIIETGSKELIKMLSSMGYTVEHMEDSPNMLFVPKI